jgi:hypothetical protein
MAKQASKKSENKGGQEPKTIVLSPWCGAPGAKTGGKLVVKAANSHLSLASGSFIAARAKAKDR